MEPEEQQQLLEELRVENRELRRRFSELEFLGHMANWIELRMPLEEIHSEILNSLADLLNADIASLMLLEPSSGELHIRAARGLKKSIVRNTRVKLGQDISGRVAATGQGVLTQDSEKAFGRPGRKNYRTGGCIVAPIKFRGQILGVLNFADKQDGHFQEKDLEFVSRMGRHAAGMLMLAMSQKALVKQERRERELQFAHTLQTSFLPDSPPRIKGLQLAARYIPALEVSGDFYDFIPLPDKRLGILIGDVCGKGIPGAIFMARFTSDFRAIAPNATNTAEAMTRTNHRVFDRSRRGLFVTAIYLIIDPVTGQVEISNAGHPMPLLCSDRDTQVSGIDQAIDIPLGIAADTRYPRSTFKISPGESLLLVTDGVFDARGLTGERYGLDRLNAVAGRGSPAPRSLLDRMLADLRRFAGQHTSSDDVTAVAIGRPQKR
jgi:phosphoserine phosphatase RsbU/P